MDTQPYTRNGSSECGGYPLSQPYKAAPGVDHEHVGALEQKVGRVLVPARAFERTSHASLACFCCSRFAFRFSFLRRTLSALRALTRSISSGKQRRKSEVTCARCWLNSLRSSVFIFSMLQSGFSCIHRHM